jgi:GMP synthase (glutamine-hydrolysing)
MTTGAHGRPPAESDLVLVVDFGAQYAQLIARRVREARVYSEIVPHTITAEEIRARSPKAVILSGGPSSVYADGAPQVPAGFFDTGVPTLGICYGHQAMALALGGRVAQTGTAEYGRTALTVTSPGVLFEGLPTEQSVWMSHGDAVAEAPPGFTVTAVTPDTPVAGFEDTARGLYGVQFHPEVLHSEQGQRVLERFLWEAAGCRPTWTMGNVIEEQVEKDFVASTGVRLHVADARERFLTALDGITDPEDKRKTIGREFIRVFEAAAREIETEAHVEFLVQGTLYPDVVESGGGAGTSNIKSHHNVGGLPDDLQFALVEPLRTLFKDEVRQVGLELGLPEEIVWRQPFPGPGLGIRIIGSVTAERLEVLREADAIAREELTAAGLDRDIWQCPVVLLADVRSVGVQGDGRTYGHPVVLRPVSSEDAMTADWARVPYDVLARISTRITNEVREVNRVVLDVTSKPPGTIEWE